MIKEIRMFAENAEQELNALLEQWTDNDTRTRAAFIEFKDHLAAMEGVTLQFKGRPGVSYSLRATHAAQTSRTLFVLVDVVDDDPEARWLSVCFYADMIQDPDELGDWVPGGLLGEDACCLNLEEDDEEMRTYIKSRLSEACASAKA